ncbi:MAG: hypothetical protein K2L93_03625, partial [Muribaculaceae bacterium]|nr:hypothetical protein [Muribaculaceae bacterium]
SGGGDSGTEETPADKEAAKFADDPHYPEYYLKQIPSTPQERQTCNDIIQEGLYNMGVILKDKLEDYPASLSEFNRLLTRYPDNVYRLDTYYNMYLIYMRQGNLAEAEHYRQLIMSDFPESKYGVAMQDPKYLDNLKAMPAIQEELYQQAYQAYLDNNNERVHSIYDEMRKRYPMSKIMPKFMFIEALTYVTQNDPEKFQSTLKEMLELYPETDITPVASSYLKQLNQGRKLHSGPVNTRGMLWDIRLGNDSTASGSTGQPANFEINPDAKQLLVLTYPTDSVSANQLLYDIARHNFTTFVVRDFELEQMNFGRLGMLIIKGFDNQRDLDHYRKTMSQDIQLQLPPQVRPIIISAQNFETLIREGRSLDEYFRFLDENNYRQAQENVLPPEVFGPAETLKEREEEAPGEPALDITDAPRHVEPDSIPAAPVTLPAPQQPAEKSVEKSVEKPIEKPAEKPAKPAQPLPQFPEGSEGDDPLFDEP